MPSGLHEATADPMYEIQYGSRMIKFSIEYRKRKTLGITVNPSGSVQVVAPHGKTEEEVISAVTRRARWIVKKQDYFERLVRTTPLHEYVSGETFRYLGRQYLLKVIPVSYNETESVKLIGGYLRVSTTRADDVEHKERLVQQWYRSRAREKFEDRLEVCLERVRRYGVERPELSIRTMENRWGSCTRGGKILLNPKLVQAPTHCIDYVITHELCYLRFHDHGKEFHTLLERVMPNWKLSKAKLESIQG